MIEREGTCHSTPPSNTTVNNVSSCVLPYLAFYVLVVLQLWNFVEVKILTLNFLILIVNKYKYDLSNTKQTSSNLRSQNPLIQIVLFSQLVEICLAINKMVKVEWRNELVSSYSNPP